MRYGRKNDPSSQRGNGFPSIIPLNMYGTISAYTSHVDSWLLPPAINPDIDNNYATISDLQLSYQTLGVGGSGSDNFRLYLVDQTADIAGTGTVSTSGNTVTGVGTSFQSFFVQNQLIRAGNNTFMITNIASNTSMTIEASPGVAWSSLSFYKVPYLALLATLTVPANTQFLAPVDLRSTLHVGLSLTAGQGLRLDTAAIGTGYTTTPAHAKLRASLEMFGITC